VESTNPTHEIIKAFLAATLADGPIPLRHIHQRAIDAGLLTADETPLWRKKSWRRVAARLGVKHEQREREWVWRLISPKHSQVPIQAPAISDTSQPDAQVPIEAIAAAIRSFLSERRKWNGKPSQLLDALRAKNKDWPANPKAFSAALRNSADQLRNTGIYITFG
jgi:hypothetical protein